MVMVVVAAAVTVMVMMRADGRHGDMVVMYGRHWCIELWLKSASLCLTLMSYAYRFRGIVNIIVPQTNANCTYSQILLGSSWLRCNFFLCTGDIYSHT